MAAAPASPAPAASTSLMANPYAQHFPPPPKAAPSAASPAPVPHPLPHAVPHHHHPSTYNHAMRAQQHQHQQQQQQQQHSQQNAFGGVSLPPASSMQHLFEASADPFAAALSAAASSSAALVLDDPEAADERYINQLLSNSLTRLLSSPENASPPVTAVAAKVLSGEAHDRMLPATSAATDPTLCTRASHSGGSGNGSGVARSATISSSGHASALAQPAPQRQQPFGDSFFFSPSLSAGPTAHDPPSRASNAPWV